MMMMMMHYDMLYPPQDIYSDSIPTYHSDFPTMDTDAPNIRLLLYFVFLLYNKFKLDNEELNEDYHMVTYNELPNFPYVQHC